MPVSSILSPGVHGAKIPGAKMSDAKMPGAKLSYDLLLVPVPVSSILSTGAGLRWLRSVALIPSHQQHHAALQVCACNFDNQLTLLLIVVNETQHAHEELKHNGHDCEDEDNLENY